MTSVFNQADNTMLLQWVQSIDKDENTSFSSALNKSGCIYAIEPTLYNNSINYVVTQFDPTGKQLSISINGKKYPSSRLAKQACDNVEIKLTDSAINVSDLIVAWTKENHRLHTIETKRVARHYEGLVGIDEKSIQQMLDCMVAQDILVPEYSVVSPFGPLGSSSGGRYHWPSIDKIPKRLRDTGGEQFRTDDGEIIPTYCLANHKSVGNLEQLLNDHKNVTG